MPDSYRPVFNFSLITFRTRAIVQHSRINHLHTFAGIVGVIRAVEQAPEPPSNRLKFITPDEHDSI
jgi:hypothetical protein